MNKTLIRNWNSVVSDNDEVYIVGDVAFCTIGKLRDIITGELNGRKHLIRGNHDEFDPDEYIWAGFETITSLMCMNIPGVGPVGISHDPSNCIMFKNMPWLNGHLHEQYKVFFNSINVGVDVNNFTPVAEDDLVPLLQRVKEYSWDAYKKGVDNDPKRKKPLIVQADGIER